MCISILVTYTLIAIFYNMQQFGSYSDLFKHLAMLSSFSSLPTFFLHFEILIFYILLISWWYNSFVQVLIQLSFQQMSTYN